MLASTSAWANCSYNSASSRTSEQNVGPITNLVKEKGTGVCTVKFDITVNGTTHHLEETEKGYEQEESLCYYARERARKNLLLDLGGKISADATMVCSEGKPVKERKYKIGDRILESEVGRSKIEKYFTYDNSRCRMFTQRVEVNKDTRVYNGVICQANQNEWTIVDKW